MKYSLMQLVFIEWLTRKMKKSKASGRSEPRLELSWPVLGPDHVARPRYDLLQILVNIKNAC